ncbi:alkaline phosphatase family protein [Rhodoblastus sp.]|uniref:alkaline phosphatase family protein n=2 Tax=Rhodoblastus sp. TaxID=1962975 RepID=UPI003F9769E2
MKKAFKQALASGAGQPALLILALLAPARADPAGDLWRGEFAGQTKQELVRPQPDPTPDVAPFMRDDDSSLGYSAATQDRTIRALQKRVKFVFVIFNENQSFDDEFGTFPGVDGLYSDGEKPRAAAGAPGFTQSYVDKASGLTVSVQPFRIGPRQNATVADSTDHSHKGLAKKIDVVDGAARMDGFAADEYGRYANGTPSGEAKARQFARLVMSYMDCETVPFLWRWASRFTIFDHIFAAEDGPSSPNAVAMLAGQGGESQWVEHGAREQAFPAVAPVCGVTYADGATQAPPMFGDAQPFHGSQFDGAAKDREPAGCREHYASTNIMANLTFASLPLSLLGETAKRVADADLNKPFDLPDVRQDLDFLSRGGEAPVSWRWYQEGYDFEPTDTGPTASHKSYVSHHNGAQYFGYIANNPQMSANLKGLGDFFDDIAKGRLPDGGVIYIRGGYENIAGLSPPIQNPNFPAPLVADDMAAIRASKAGDDDHPGYSDRQISEAMAARVINAIASDEKLWSESAILIAYDESDGHYDHVPPRILAYGPDKLPLARGARVPLILISPYARAHAVSSAEGDHNAIIETINAIFGRTPLAKLPDEARALAAGDSPEFNQFGPPGFHQKFLGPRDLPAAGTQSLLSGFDLGRLEGAKPPLPAALAIIPDTVVDKLPHYGDAPGGACQAIGVVPEDRRQHIEAPPPPGFNSLPSTLSRYN